MKSSTLGRTLCALSLCLSLPAAAESYSAITLSDTGETDNLGRHILTGSAELTSGYRLALQTGPDDAVFVASLKTPDKEHRAAFFVRDSSGTGIGVGTHFLDTQHQPGDYDGELLDWRRIERDIDDDGQLDVEYRIGNDENGYVVQLFDNRGVVVDARARSDIYCQTERSANADGAVTQAATFWLPGMDDRMGYVGLHNTQATPDAPWETLSLQVLATDWPGNGETMKLPASVREGATFEAVDQDGRAFLIVDGQPLNSFSGSAGACGQPLTQGNVTISLNQLQPAEPAKSDLQDLLIKMNYSLNGDWADAYANYADYSGGTDTWILLTGIDNQNQPITWLGKIQEEREYVGNNSTRLRYLFDNKLIDTLASGNSYQLQAFMEVTVNLAETRTGATPQKRLTPLHALANFTVDAATNAQ